MKIEKVKSKVETSIDERYQGQYIPFLSGVSRYFKFILLYSTPVGLITYYLGFIPFGLMNRFALDRSLSFSSWQQLAEIPLFVLFVCSFILRWQIRKNYLSVLNKLGKGLDYNSFSNSRHKLLMNLNLNSFCVFLIYFFVWFGSSTIFLQILGFMGSKMGDMERNFALILAASRVIAIYTLIYSIIYWAILEFQWKKVLKQI